MQYPCVLRRVPELVEREFFIELPGQGNKFKLLQREKEFCIDNLLVRIHLIIERILVDRHVMGVWIRFSR